MFCDCCAKPSQDGGELSADTIGPVKMTSVFHETAEKERLAAGMDEIAEIKQPKAADSPSSATYRTYVVILPAGEQLGLVVETSDPKLTVVKGFVPGGLADNWNQTCAPDCVIEVWHRMVEVNGKRGSGQELLQFVEETKRLGNTSLLMEVPQMLVVPIDKKGRDLGIDFEEMRLCLKIIGVKDGGVVPDYNAESKTDAQIEEQCRIVKVNDSAENGGEGILQQLQSLDSMEITVAKWSK